MKIVRYHVGQIVIICVFAWIFVVSLVWQAVGPCSLTLYDHVCDEFPDLSTISSEGNLLKYVSMTPVYVIEEHHEALMYWYHAANNGLIKRYGNVLFHIDAHSDGATPEDRSVLPLFRWPSKLDVFNMMQRNDVFVVAAGFTGLIKRYIWVWSPWDIDPKEPIMSDHHIIQVQLGTVKRPELPNGRDICFCMEPFPLPPGMTGVECYMPNITHLYEDTPGVLIDMDVCDIHLSDGVVEVVTEDRAIELLKSGTWITPQENIILDIDEDYYGCEAAVQLLYDVDITEKKLIWINYFVGRLFCATTTFQERQADKFYANLIDRILNLRRICNGSVIKLCSDAEKFQEFVMSWVDELFIEIKERQLDKIVCDTDKIARRALGFLLKRFSHYAPRELHAMKEIGICLMSSPRMKIFDAKQGMRVCDGYNRPNHTYVTFHTPTEEEVDLRTRRLNTMLTSLVAPGVVTVCRSMRDGYTPRKFFHKIEKDVLNVLTEVFPKIDGTMIFFDEFLMGGTYGWPNRHL